MLVDELKDLLRELADTVGAFSVAITHEQPAHAVVPGRDCHVTALGNGAYLFVELAHIDGQDRNDLQAERAGTSCIVAMEHCARALRACIRRWGESRIPALTLGHAAEPSKERVAARIAAFLQALANVQHAVNAVVVRHGRIVAAASEPSDEQRASVAFTHRRLIVEASRKRDTSHAELVSDSYYAVSFWYDACLIAFFSSPYAVDFFRHRARLVTRELSHLLPMLDDPPPAGVNVAPIPE